MKTAVRLTILVDNTAAPGLIAEHGLSFWIEFEGHKLLLDTGQKNALILNSETLGIDISETDALILSHGHYDHTGSIPDVLKRAHHVHIYLHSATFLPRYRIHDGAATSIRMPGESMIAVMKLPEKRIHWVSQPACPFEGVGITGPVPRKTDFENTGGPFFLDPKGERQDLIEDDLALWIRTDAGLVVCVGCCHAGLVNTLRYLMDLTGERRIHTLIGGFHLSNANEDRLERTVAQLRLYHINQIIPCHCTGESAVEYLKKNLPCPVYPGYAGFTLQIHC